MHAIVHLHNLDEVNGTLIDSVEYWLFMQNLGYPVHYATNLSPSFVRKLIDSRYKYVEEHVYSYIIDIHAHDFSNVLMFGSTYLKIGATFPSDRLRCIHTYSSWSTIGDHPLFFRDYRKKLYMSNIRCNNPKKRKYLHRSSFILRECEATLEYLSNETDDVAVYISPKDVAFASQFRKDKPNVHFIPGGIVSDFFEQFDELVYVFERPDFSPRLFIECAYLEKRLTYVGQPGSRDGSVERFLDAQNRDLSKYSLSFDDEAVAWLSQ